MQLPISADGGLASITINIFTQPPPAGAQTESFAESVSGKLESRADDEQDMDYLDCPGFIETFMSVTTPMPIPGKQLKRKLAALVDRPDEFILRYYHYSTMHHTLRRMPVVSAINIDGNPGKRKDPAARKDRWMRDNRIDFSIQLNDAFFKNSNFDKGHMSRREDANWDKNPTDAKRDADLTCMYTNTCPQSPYINRAIYGYHGLWGQLEQVILEQGVKVEEGKTTKICVYNGPIFVDTDPVFRGVQTPLRFYKVVVWLNDAGQPNTTAFILSQEDLVSDVEFEELQYNKAFIDHQCSIPYLENLTGLFFTGIRDWDTFQKDGPGGKEVKRLEGADLESLIKQKSNKHPI